MPITKSIHSTNAAAARAQRARIYRDPRWRACRTLVLTRANHTCALCGAKATIADHAPWPLATLLAAGADPYNPDTCRALCAQCSGKQDGGKI